MNTGFETLRYGSRGSRVLLLQLALKRAGYLGRTPNCEFGNSTVNAVRLFRAAHGLSPEGEADGKTFEAASPYLEGFIRVKLKPRSTFYRLGKRYGVSAERIAAANPGLDPALIPPGKEAVVPLPFALTPSDIPFFSELAEYCFRGLQARYPFISLSEYGKSVLGRPLYSLTIGRGRSRILIAAAVHANEWITAPLLLDAAESLASAFVTHGTFAGRSAAALLASVKLTLVPLANPDGVDLVNSAVSPAGYETARRIAEQNPDIPFPSGWKANITGTDLNLNFPVRRQEALRIKRALGVSGPAPRDWPGEAPLSAPEARALAELTEKTDPAALIALHTQGAEVLWRCAAEEEPPRARAAAYAMADASGYEMREVPPASANGGFRDWFVHRFARPGFTVEAGRGANPLPLSEYGRIRQELFPLIAAAAEKLA